MYLLYVPVIFTFSVFLIHVRDHVRIHVHCHVRIHVHDHDHVRIHAFQIYGGHFNLTMNPTPFSAALATSGELSKEEMIRHYACLGYTTREITSFLTNLHGEEVR